MIIAFLPLSPRVSNPSLPPHSSARVKTLKSEGGSRAQTLRRGSHHRWQRSETSR